MAAWQESLNIKLDSNTQYPPFYIFWCFLQKIPEKINESTFYKHDSATFIITSYKASQFHFLLWCKDWKWLLRLLICIFQANLTGAKTGHLRDNLFDTYFLQWFWSRGTWSVLLLLLCVMLFYCMIIIIIWSFYDMCVHSFEGWIYMDTVKSIWQKTNFFSTKQS